MKRAGTGEKLVAAAVLLSVLLTPAAGGSASGLSESEERGRRIYTKGEGAGPIFAFLVSPGIKAPGKGFPCINCHVEGGGGQREGGVLSADITYYNLTKDYGGTRPSGRAHPPYDDESLGSAVTSGLDPAGNELNAAHPRYEMGREDLRDLIAYLKAMGREPVPGITDNEVRVGMMAPRSGPLASAGESVKAFLSGCFEEVNGRGGLFGRYLRLVPVPFDPGPPGEAAAAREVASGGELFCLLANLGLPQDGAAAKILSAAGVPVLAPLLIPAENAYGMDRNTFHVSSSFRDQARVMADFAADNLVRPGAKVAIVHAGDGSGQAGAAGVKEQAEKRGLPVAAEESYPPGEFAAAPAAARLVSGSPDAVLFFGSGADALAFLTEADRKGWRPYFLAPAAMVGSSLLSLPPELAAKVYLASPSGRPDPSSEGASGFSRIAGKYRSGREHVPFRMAAFAGVKLLEEGLRLSGRSVSRAGFVARLGALWAFESGVTPPLTYDGNRSVGTRGAAMLAIDSRSRRLVPAADWREPR